MDKLISVVIPVYNRETTLRKCVDSILAQTYENIEVILVNDGSTDRSEDICRSYEQADSRVSVISKANGGLSSARNAGIDGSHGEYLFFVDSDDWIDSDTLEVLLKTALRKDTDVTGCCTYFNYPNKYYYTDIGLRNARLNYRQYDPGHIMENLIYNELLRRGYSVDVGVVTDRTKGANTQKEIDFVVNDADRKIYIQSAFRMDTEQKTASELDSLLLTKDFFKKINLIRNFSLNTSPDALCFFGYSYIMYRVEYYPCGGAV